MSLCYLRIGDDTLEQASSYRSLAAAVNAYREVAMSLRRFDQTIEATVHRAPSRDQLAEYPDYVLSVGPNGGIRCDRC